MCIGHARQLAVIESCDRGNAHVAEDTYILIIKSISSGTYYFDSMFEHLATQIPYAGNAHCISRIEAFIIHSPLR